MTLSCSPFAACVADWPHTPFLLRCHVTIIPKTNPPPNYQDHPGTVLQRGQITVRPIGVSGARPWVLQLAPIKQTFYNIPIAPPPPAAPNSPPMNRNWWKLLLTSYTKGSMQIGQDPNNGRPINQAQWNLAAQAWNSTGGYLGHNYHSGEQMFMSLNMKAVPRGLPSLSSPPDYTSPPGIYPPLAVTPPTPWPAIASIQRIGAVRVLCTFSTFVTTTHGSQVVGVTCPANALSATILIDNITNVTPLDAATSFLAATSFNWTVGLPWTATGQGPSIPYISSSSGLVT